MSLCPFQPEVQSPWRSIPGSGGLRRLARAGVAALALAGTIATPALADQPVTYTVQAGDTLVEIAQQFSVPTASIVNQNGLPNPNQLAIGQTLEIKVPAAPNTMPTITELRSHAHYPSFAISPEGMVVRALTIVPPPPNILSAPYHSQFDGTIWAESNCGPTTLSMALGALGVNADQLKLRNLANDQMGMANPNSGTTWESLAYAAKASGAKIEGLYNGQSYRSWTIDDLKKELDQGHPVMLLVRYWSLPDHAGSAFSGDHYVVGLGFDRNGNLIYDDPASSGNGSGQTISPAALDKAWSDTWVGLTRTAMALYQ